MKQDVTIRAAVYVQPPPTGDDAVVLDWVGNWAESPLFDALEARADMGLERYGTLLQAHNGRWTLADAYQEALDLVMYLAQADIEAGLRIPSARTVTAVELVHSLIQDLREEARGC